MSDAPKRSWSAARRAACTDEYRARLSDAKKGTVPWNKGLNANGLPKKRTARRAGVTAKQRT